MTVTAIITLDDVEAHLNLTDATNDAELQGFIDGITPVVESFVGPVVHQTLDEWYDGVGPRVVLRHRPVVSVTSVVEYAGTTAFTLTGVANPALGSTYTYTVENGVLTRRSSGAAVDFAHGLSNVHVVYVAGRATVSANIRLGALELVRVNFQQTQQGGRPAFNSTGALEQFDEGSMVMGFFVPNRVREMLTPSRKFPSMA